MKTKARLRGMLLASLAASLWSISGISGEILFKEFHFSADWLVSVRTAVSGILLLIAVVFIEKKSSCLELPEYTLYSSPTLEQSN